MAESLLQGAGLIKPTATRYSPAATRYSPDSPEGMINQQAALMRKQIQTEFQTEWDSLRGRVSGQDRHKAKYAMDELHERFRGRVTKLNQDVEQKLSGLSQIDQLGVAGLIPNAGEVKWRQTLGPEAETAMFPKQDKPADPMAEFGKLDVYRNRIESRIKEFRVRPGREGRSVRHPFRGQRDTELEIFEPTAVGEDKKGEFRGTWRKATLDEVKEYGVLTREQKRVTAAQQPMMGSLMNTAVNSRRMGGAIQDQAKAYIQEKTEAGPKRLDEGVARSIMQEAGGDADKARQIARSRGYNF